MRRAMKAIRATERVVWIDGIARYASGGGVEAVGMKSRRKK
jgi:hypothetical protein